MKDKIYNFVLKFLMPSFLLIIITYLLIVINNQELWEEIDNIIWCRFNFYLNEYINYIFKNTK